MKKFLIILLTLITITGYFSAKEMKTDFLYLNKKVGTFENVTNFVNFELASIISIKNPLIKGKILGTNEISGIKIHKIQWTYKDIPVEGSYTVIKEKKGVVYSVVNSLEDFSIETTPALSPVEAAKSVFIKNYDGFVSNPDFIHNLIIVKKLGKYRLAYKLRFRPSSIFDGRFFYIDAETGEFLGNGNFVMKASGNTAKVFKTNPVRDKTPIEIELPWVADDMEGKLTSEIDEKGIRKVVASNCLDLGEKLEYYGSTYPICTPTQTANKGENGNFIYEDWNDGIAYKMNADDTYSEVAVYYHMTKIYSYLINLGVKNFTHLGTHEKDGQKNPIIGVGNFRMPQSTAALAPMDNAFYSPHDPYFKEMFFQNFEYEGDIIVLGQGQRADFAYDGDVIYHEFGHATIEGTAKLSYSAYPDKYGYSNETLGLNEGMADTFSFIISGDPCLGEYVSQAYGARYGYEKQDGYYCLRHAENEELVNESFTGESHHDGLPAVATHWLMYQKALEKGYNIDDFARYFMTALLSIPFSDLNYKGWGKILIKTVPDSPFPELQEEFEKILEEKGFYDEIRARNIMNKAQYLFSGGIGQYQGMPSNTLKVEIEGNTVTVSPMYVQLYYDVPDCVDTLTISGTPTDGQSANSTSSPIYSLLVKKDKPVIWTVEEKPQKVNYDTYIKNTGTNKWIIKGLESGKRYYFQFINSGPEGMLYNPVATGSWTSSDKCEDLSESDSDEDVADDDSFFEDDKINPEKKNNESGCSLSF